jgi:hypothetical protein
MHISVQNAAWQEARHHHHHQIPSRLSSFISHCSFLISPSSLAIPRRTTQDVQILKLDAIGTNISNRPNTLSLHRIHLKPKLGRPLNHVAEDVIPFT